MSTNSPQDPQWYKDAVIYQLHIKAFFDAEDRGIGNFRGLTSKLDYLQELGVTTLWVLPFYPSPLRDDGYDIADYKNVNPSYGTLEDFKVFVREAHKRGLKVITELVINHTSDQHPWFQRARRAPAGSPLRDYYVWSDTDQKYQGTRIIFLDTEPSNWSWDPVAKAYYWHRFFSHQPDLNFDNPKVLRAVINVMKFWLDLGVDGMRLDAVPYLIEREGTNNENLPETHEVLKKLRTEIDAAYEGRMLLAEANQWPEDVLPYFGNDDECHMAFHFPLMPRLYMALAEEDRHPITDIMRQTPDIPANCQWAVFLRNHDELTLEMVTDRERDYLWNTYAADMRMRINLGIRRRLAPLMDNDRRRIDLLNALLFSMPGTPVLYYGDEIGMGDNVYLGDRDGVRTPMQWSPDRNGGFSRADPARLYLPAIMDPVYGFQSVNVEAQQRTSNSPLNAMKRLIAARQARHSFGRGTIRFLYPSNRKVLAYLREHDDERILCIVNLSRNAQAAELDLAEFRSQVPVELLGRSAFPPIGEAPYLLTLPPYSFYWFRMVDQSVTDPTWRLGESEPMEELVTLAVSKGAADLLAGHTALQLGRDVLPQYLPKQRWFAAKDQRIQAIRVLSGAELQTGAGPSGGTSTILMTIEVSLNGGEKQDYLLPVAIGWEQGEPRTARARTLLAEVRQFRREGYLFEATQQPTFVRAAVEAMANGTTLPTSDGSQIRFACTSALTPIPEGAEIRRVGAEQSNSSILIDDFAVLKAYRRLHHGVHPELEITRFLTERAGFANTPPLLGWFERIGADGQSMALGVLFAFVRNQGDAWTRLLDYLRRTVEQRLLTAMGDQAGEGSAAEQGPTEVSAIFAAQLGQRTGEMHRALCPMEEDTDPAFTPEPITAEDLARWQAEVRESAHQAFELLSRRRSSLDDPSLLDRSLLDRLNGRRSLLLERIDAVIDLPAGTMKTRIHGDYHLGQVLFVQNDFQIIDFEGEPARPMAERRHKHTPLKDVAGMLRSFDYAAASAAREIATDREGAGAQIRALTRSWRDEAAQEYLQAYRGVMDGVPSYPPQEAGARQLLDFFLIEKALYELKYELANRPDWAEIPVRGLLALLGDDDA